MAHEGCDHDDVMCHRLFINRITEAYLCRALLREGLKDGHDWTLAVTADCAPYLHRLAALHLERVGAPMRVLPLPEIRLSPVICALPKALVSYDDLVAAIGEPSIPRTQVEAKEWLLVTHGDTESGLRALAQWIAVDPLLN
jgi:hypothetical protein